MAPKRVYWPVHGLPIPPDPPAVPRHLLHRLGSLPGLRRETARLYKDGRKALLAGDPAQDPDSLRDLYRQLEATDRLIVQLRRTLLGVAP